MTAREFEQLLDAAVQRMNESAQAGSAGFANAEQFELTVAADLRVACRQSGFGRVDNTFHRNVFPDILVNGFGVEVKFTSRRTWQGTGNSIFEGMRDVNTDLVYVVFCRADLPEIRWRRYEDCIKGVRISHSPRYMIDMEIDTSFFDDLQVSYTAFNDLSIQNKMRHVRAHVKERISEHERLWWIDEQGDHTLPLQVRLYRLLPKTTKTMLRAEAALMCPEIFKGSRQKGKYDKAALYLLTQHGVFAPQTRDLFSAGSVAGTKRGGSYLLRALQHIEDDIVAAAERLDDALFTEFWGFSCAPDDRILKWLEMADQYATDFRPSVELFGGKYSRKML